MLDWLTGSADACAFTQGLASGYNGFNLVTADVSKGDWHWFSNRATGQGPVPLQAGLHGLSNAALDTPWPKVVRAKAQFASLLCQGAPDGAYFDMLADTTRASDCRLPKTGVSLEWERLWHPYLAPLDDALAAAAKRNWW